MSSYTYRFDCTMCGESKVQTAPPDLKFILYYDEKRNELDPQQSPATCAKCTKIIDEHNAPIEAIIHCGSVANKAKRKADADEPRPTPIKKTKPKQVTSLPPAEQTTPDPMALLAGAIASLVQAQEATNAKLEQLINGKGKQTTSLCGPVQSGGRRKDAPKSAGDPGRQNTDESSERVRKPLKRSSKTNSK